MVRAVFINRCVMSTAIIYVNNLLYPFENFKINADEFKGNSKTILVNFTCINTHVRTANCSASVNLTALKQINNFFLFHFVTFLVLSN